MIRPSDPTEPRRGRLFVLSGPSGVGKSTLARTVARELRAAYLDKDTIKDAALALGRELKVENAERCSSAPPVRSKSDGCTPDMWLKTKRVRSAASRTGLGTSP